MQIKRQLILAFSFLIFYNASAQNSGKFGHYFDDPIIVDSSSTIIIPTRYSSDLFSSNKLDFWGDYYANITFYNFKTDSSKKLFQKDTYIMSFSGYGNTSYYGRESKNRNISKHIILYKVKNADHNKNGRIDLRDPALLYVSDIYGNKLKPLTTENENIVSIELFDKQGFALIKIQRDSDNDLDFENEDNDFYFVKLDLTTLQFGNKIEIK